MPYSMKGGDTPASDAWMEKCVAAVKKTGKDEGSAVAICKAQYEKVAGSNGA